MVTEAIIMRAVGNGLSDRIFVSILGILLQLKIGFGANFVENLLDLLTSFSTICSKRWLLK